MAADGRIRYFESIFVCLLSLGPNDVDVLYNKGVVLDELGNSTQAIQYYNKALSIDPNDVDVLNNIANALAKVGRHIEAIKYYQKAIEILKSNHSNESASYSYSKTALDEVGTSATYWYIIANEGFLSVQYNLISDLQNAPVDQKVIMITINYANTLTKAGDTT